MTYSRLVVLLDELFAELDPIAVFDTIPIGDKTFYSMPPIGR
jgi:ABC-type lipopolysaccharide export system ATPase subunit